jgi:phosphoribosylamine--glycine ligase
MLEQNAVLANGGRVLAVNAVGENLRQAIERAYAAVDSVAWPDGFCRRDIGIRALHAGV